MFRRTASAVVLILIVAAPTDAGITVFDANTIGSLDAFNAAAGNPPISIDFDAIASGTNINGTTIAGVMFQPSATGAPLIVVRGNDTFTDAGFAGVIDAATNKLFPTTGENVLSPGGLTLGPGPNDPIENDDLVLTFQTPLAAFGFDHLSQSADGFSGTQVAVFNQSNSLLYSATIPISDPNNIGGGAPGGADFWGAVATGSDRIARIEIDEIDDNNLFPDSNIGFDTFRFTPAVPEPCSLALFGLGSAAVVCYGCRRGRRS